MCSMAPWWAWDECNQKWKIYSSSTSKEVHSSSDGIEVLDGLGKMHYYPWWYTLTSLRVINATETKTNEMELGTLNCTDVTSDSCFPQEYTMDFVLTKICPGLSYVCFIVSFIRMSLESIQLYNNGMDYFQGWCVFNFFKVSTHTRWIKFGFQHTHFNTLFARL